MIIIFHSFIVLLSIWTTLFPIYSLAVSQKELIEQCLANKLAGKKLRQVNQESQMYLTLGHYGIETMNALSLYQIRQITYLAECTAEIVTNLFMPT